MIDTSRSALLLGAGSFNNPCRATCHLLRKFCTSPGQLSDEALVVANQLVEHTASHAARINIALPMITCDDTTLSKLITASQQPLQCFGRLVDVGPKTYARVCELLLRLKANMLAPAMHSCTGAFYSHPESKIVCDSFVIIITTSHCEPLLLNNAAKSEWDQQRDGDWNYKTNRETIWKKWDDRLSEASQYENIYTLAMRGVHDEGLKPTYVGPNPRD